MRTGTVTDLRSDGTPTSLIPVKHQPTNDTIADDQRVVSGQSKDLLARIHINLGQVFDPEYPDISIVDLGLVEAVTASDDGTVEVGLIPTFSGCPALAMIAKDVTNSLNQVPGVTNATVTWLTTPVWSTDRTTKEAQRRLSSEYTVVLRRKDGTLRCPICGSNTVTDQSMAGPTRCRSLAWCPSCRNPVEVMR